MAIVYEFRIAATLPQLCLRKTRVAVHRCLHQRIQNAAADPEIGIHGDTGLRRDLIRHAESHAADIVGKFIRILLQNRVDHRTVFSVDLHREIHGNAVSLQEHHGLPHFLLLLHLIGDLHRHPLADALDLREALRLFLHDTECILPELFHDPPGQRRSDPFDRAGRQILFHRNRILRRQNLVVFHLKLLAVYRMHGHAAFRIDHLALRKIGKCSHKNIFLPVVRTGYAHDRISVLFIPEFNLFDVTLHLRHVCSQLSRDCLPKDKRRENVSGHARPLVKGPARGHFPCKLQLI